MGSRQQFLIILTSEYIFAKIKKNEYVVFDIGADHRKIWEKY